MVANPQNLHKGRSGKNKPKRVYEIIGQQNYDEIIMMQLDIAKHCEDIEMRNSSQQFLISRVSSKPRPEESFVKFKMNDMLKMEDVLTNEISILRKVSEGEISLEEAEKLFTFTTNTRKTFEQTEIARMINEFKENIKDQAKN